MKIMEDWVEIIGAIGLVDEDERVVARISPSNKLEVAFTGYDGITVIQLPTCEITNYAEYPELESSFKFDVVLNHGDDFQVALPVVIDNKAAWLVVDTCDVAYINGEQLDPSKDTTSSEIFDVVDLPDDYIDLVPYFYFS